MKLFKRHYLHENDQKVNPEEGGPNDLSVSMRTEEVNGEKNLSSYKKNKEERKNQAPLKADVQDRIYRIKPLDFNVFLKIDKPEKPVIKFKKQQRLQYLSILILFVVAIATHSWIFVEQHLMRYVITPIILVVSGAFFDEISASQDTPKDPSSKSKDDKSPADTPNSDPTKKENNPNPPDQKPSESTANNSSTPDTSKNSENNNVAKNEADKGAKNSPNAPVEAGKNANTTENNSGTSLPQNDSKNTNKDATTKPPEDDFDPLSLDSTRIKILMSLNVREKEMKKREEKIREKEVSYGVIDKQLDQKRQELLELKKIIETIARNSNEDVMKSVKKMVIIYEAMKAEAAAKIFNELPQEVLCGLVKQMNPKKSSLIMSMMNVDKVKALTDLLAYAPYVPEEHGGKNPPAKK